MRRRGRASSWSATACGDGCSWRSGTRRPRRAPRRRAVHGRRDHARGVSVPDPAGRDLDAPANRCQPGRSRGSRFRADCAAGAGRDVGAGSSRTCREYARPPAGTRGYLLGWEAAVIPLRDWYIGADQRQVLWLLIGAVAIVLLTACANVANLLLARGRARREEFAVRLTLGSSRGAHHEPAAGRVRAARRGGALVGLALSIWAREAFVNLLPPGSPFRLLPIETDWWVVSYALAVAMASVLAAGLAPVRHALRVDLISVQGERVVPTRLRKSLLVAQTAATVLLLAGAALLVRSFLNVWSIDPGFSRANVLTARIGLPAGSPASRRTAFFDDLLGRLASDPWHAGRGDLQPPSRRRQQLQLHQHRRPAGAARRRPSCGCRASQRDARRVPGAQHSRPRRTRLYRRRHGGGAARRGRESDAGRRVSFPMRVRSGNASSGYSAGAVPMDDDRRGGR